MRTPHEWGTPALHVSWEPTVVRVDQVTVTSPNAPAPSWNRSGAFGSAVLEVVVPVEAGVHEEGVPGAHAGTRLPRNLKARLRVVHPSDVGDWIKQQTDRYNLLIDARLGGSALSRDEPNLGLGRWL